MEVDAEIDRLLVARKMEIIGEMFTSFFFFGWLCDCKRNKARMMLFQLN